MRETTFTVRVTVSERLKGIGFPLHAERGALTEQTRHLRGPRGGRYVAVGELFDFRDGQTDEDWMRNTRTFTARVRGRYVRPERE